MHRLASPSRTPPPRPGCHIANSGPVVGYSYANASPEPFLAGPITDGTYDLVKIVRHSSETGPWSSGQMPAFRWALRFTTTETSSNHTSGILHSAAEIPPNVACGGTRFATFQTELRVTGGVKGIESLAYSARGDTLSLFQADGDGGTPITYVFQRRP